MRFEEVTRRLQRANVEVGRTRGTFDPVIEAIPTLGTLAVLVVGTRQVRRRRARRPAEVVQVAYLISVLAFPVRALGWVLGELPRTRRRLGPGRRRPRGARRAGLRRPVARVGAARVAAARERRLLLRHRRRGRRAESTFQAIHDVSIDVPAGSTVALVGPTGSGKSTLTNLTLRLVDPDRGTSRSTAPTCARCARGGVSAVAALVPQQTFMFDDTVARQHHPRRRLRRRPGLGGARGRAGHGLRRRSSPPGSTPASVSAAPPCPVASASGSRWPGPSSARRGCSSSTTRRAPSTPPVEQAILAGAARGRAPARPSSSSPTGCPRSRSPTRSSTSRAAASSTTAPTPSCSGGASATSASSRHTPAEARSETRPRWRADEEEVDRGVSTSIERHVRARHRRRRCAAGWTLSPELRRGHRRHPGPGRGHDRRPGRRARSSCSRPPTTACSARTARTRPWSRRYVLLALIAVAATAVTAYAVNVRLFRASEAGLATLRLQGVPAHPRPVDADPEHRASRVDGQPRHLGRRHDLPVRAVRRDHPHPQPRARSPSRPG